MSERSSHRASWACRPFAYLAPAVMLAAASCSGPESVTLPCEDATVSKVTHVLKVTPSSRAAELLVHVPQDSIERGTPSGSRIGRALVSDRAYDITIPADLLRRYPFGVVYRIEPARILIIAVAHGHRRPGYWRGRA